MSDERLVTPAVSIDVALWLSTLGPNDLAYVVGASVQRLAMLAGITEADLYADFAKRASEDHDAQVIREP